MYDDWIFFDLIKDRKEIGMALLGKVKSLSNSWLRKRGHVVENVANVPSIGRLVKQLHCYNIVPNTVFDIGVASGTPWLYAAFPDAKFHLVDPTRESLAHMKVWAEKLEAEIHNIAIGRSNDTMSIRMRETIKHATLMIDITTPEIMDVYEVPVERFDERFAIFETPALCKIDVEGAELAVLEGMGDRIREIAVIIVETSMNSLYEEGPEFADIVALLRESGFVFYDYIGLARRPFDEALHQFDAVFIPGDSPLRTKRWD